MESLRSCAYRAEYHTGGDQGMRRERGQEQFAILQSVLNAFKKRFEGAGPHSAVRKSSARADHFTPFQCKPLKHRVQNSVGRARKLQSFPPVDAVSDIFQIGFTGAQIPPGGPQVANCDGRNSLHPIFHREDGEEPEQELKATEPFTG